MTFAKLQAELRATRAREANEVAEFLLKSPVKRPLASILKRLDLDSSACQLARELSRHPDIRSEMRPRGRRVYYHVAWFGRVDPDD